MRAFSICLGRSKLGSALDPGFWLSRTLRAASCCQKYALAEQVEVGAAVHLAFQELHARDVPLALGVAPRQFQRSPDRGVVGVEAAGEGAQGAGRAASGLFQPGVEAGTGLGPDESDEGRDCVVDGGEFVILPHARYGRALGRV